jgi:DNA modification methylase
VKRRSKGGQFPTEGTCGKCGATRIDRQMGLEPTPDEFVAGMVEVFREVRRVLRDDGTLWLNIGDSYAGGKGWRREPSGLNARRRVAAPSFGKQASGRFAVLRAVSTKDLIGIPWMLAFALRADGWYLRQDIIWSSLTRCPRACGSLHQGS